MVRRYREQARPGDGIALAALLSGAFVLTVALSPPPAVDPPPLAASAGCARTSVTPSSVVVGLADVRATFALRSGGCDVTGWTLDWPAAGMRASDDEPVGVVAAAGLRDADAGPSPLSAALALADASPGTAQVRAALLRRTTWAGSLRIRRNPDGVTLTARLSRVSWEERAYRGFPGRRVAVLFRPVGAAGYHRVLTTTAGPGGVVLVRGAAGAGHWRLRYPGDPVSAAAASNVVASR